MSWNLYIERLRRGEEYDTDSYVSEDLSDDEDELTPFSVAYRQVEVESSELSSHKIQQFIVIV